MPSTTEIIIIVVVIIVIAAYAIGIFLMYDNGTFIFQDWEQVVPPNACKPLIDIKPLSSSQQQVIKDAITDPANEQYVGPVGTYPT